MIKHKMCMRRERGEEIGWGCERENSVEVVLATGVTQKCGTYLLRVCGAIYTLT